MRSTGRGEPIEWWIFGLVFLCLGIAYLISRKFSKRIRWHIFIISSGILCSTGFLLLISVRDPFFWEEGVGSVIALFAMICIGFIGVSYWHGWLYGTFGTARQLNEVSLESAISEGDLGIVKKILDKDADAIGQRGDHGETPLHWAAYWGHEETVRALVESWADLEIVDNEGQTAADWAEERGHGRIADLLREAAGEERPE